MRTVLGRDSHSHSGDLGCPPPGWPSPSQALRERTGGLHAVGGPASPHTEAAGAVVVPILQAGPYITCLTSHEWRKQASGVRSVWSLHVSFSPHPTVPLTETCLQILRDSLLFRPHGITGSREVGPGAQALLSTASALCTGIMERNQRSLRENVWLFTVFIRREHRIFYCKNIEITAAWGAFAVKYLLGRTGNTSIDKKNRRRVWVNII